MSCISCWVSCSNSSTSLRVKGPGPPGERTYNTNAFFIFSSSSQMDQLTPFLHPELSFHLLSLTLGLFKLLSAAPCPDPLVPHI